VDDLAKIGDLEPDLAGERLDVPAVVLDFLLFFAKKALALC